MDSEPEQGDGDERDDRGDSYRPPIGPRLVKNLERLFVPACWRARCSLVCMVFGLYIPVSGSEDVRVINIAKVIFGVML